VLECLHGSPGAGAEAAGWIGQGGQALGAQPALDVGHALPGVTGTQGKGGGVPYRYAASSWSSWALPRAPTIRASGSPSLNRIRVGMLITS